MIFITISLLRLSLVLSFFLPNESILPVPVLWPTTWTVNILNLSSNHAGETITLTLTCNIPRIVPSGSIAELRIAGFASLYYSATSDQPKSKDNTFTFDYVKLPYSSGSYGPVSLTVYYPGNFSQMLASSSSLGSIAILPLLPLPSKSLTVRYPAGSSNTILESTSLEIAFIVNVNIAYHDYFVLKVNKLFSFDSDQQPVWDVNANGTRYFTQSRAVFNKDQGELGVYGLQENIKEKILVNFTLGGVRNPERLVRHLDWEVVFYKFGTRTVIQRFVNAEPLNLKSGRVNSISWNPANNNTQLSIVPGMIVYMNLNFTLAHYVPKYGNIRITFDSVDLQKYSYKTSTKQAASLSSAGNPVYILNTPKSIPCVIKGPITIICESASEIPALTSLAISTLTYFSGTSARITNITTSDQTSDVIDCLESSIVLIYADRTKNQCISSEPKVYITSKSDLSVSIQTSGVIGDYGLIVSFKADTQISIGDILTVSFPLMASAGINDKLVSFSAGFFQSHASGSTELSAIDVNGGTVASPAAQTLVLAMQRAYSVGDYANIYIGSGPSLVSSANIATAAFQTSLTSWSEVLIYYKSSGITYYYSKPIYFQANSVVPSFTLFCSNSQTNGMLAQLSFTVFFSWLVPPGYSAYIDFSIVSNNPKTGGDLGSGLTSGSVYPAMVSNGGYAHLYYTDSDSFSNTAHILYYIPSSLSASMPLTLIIQVPHMVFGDSYQISSELVAKRVLDGALFTISNSSSPSTFVYNNGYLVNTATDWINFYSFNPGTPIPSLSFFVNFNNAAILHKSFLLVLDNANKFTDRSKLVSPDGTVYNLLVFESTDSSSKYHSALAYSVSIPASISDQEWTVTWLNSSWIPSQSYLSVVLTDNTGFSGASCFYDQSFGFSIDASQMRLLWYWPSEVNSFGPDDQTFNLSVQFLLPGPVVASSATKFFVRVNYELCTEGSSVFIAGGNYFESGNMTNGIFYSKGVNATLDAGTILNINISNISSPVVVNTDPVEYIVLSEFGVYFHNQIIHYWTQTGPASAIPRKTNFLSQPFPGYTIITSLSAFPANKKSQNVLFSISFVTPFTIPLGSQLTITGEPFSKDSSLSSTLFCNCLASSASISNNSLVFNTSKTIRSHSTVWITKDKAFNISNSDQSAPFYIKVHFNSLLLISDKLNRSSDIQVIQFRPQPTVSILMHGLTTSVKNMGEESWHRFSFKLPMAAEDAWKVCLKAPDAYTMFVGTVMTYQTIPEVFYLKANSSFGNVICSVQCRLITCSGLGGVGMGNLIDISIKLYNPSDISATWGMYVIDSEGNLVAKPAYSIAARFTQIPVNEVEILDVSYIDKPPNMHDLVVTTRINENLKSLAKIIVEFPKAYELTVYNPVTLACSAQYINGIHTNIAQENCSVNENSVVFTANSNINLQSSNYSVFFINNLVYPSKGLTKTNSSDTFSTFDTWTEKFKISILADPQTHPNTLTSASYSNLNAAYIGFNLWSTRSILVNANADLQLTPGTYSRLYNITAESRGLMAQAVVVEGSFNSAEVRFYAGNEFMLTQQLPLAYFRIGTSVETARGFYYISWKLKETPAIEGSFIYKLMFKTLVKVSGLNQETVKIGGPISTQIGKNSSAFGVDLNGITPYTGITITLSTSSSDFFLSTNALHFHANQTLKTFYIISSILKPRSVAQNISVSLSGPDSKAFRLQTFSILFNLTASSPPPLNISMNIHSTSPNSAELVVSGNASAVVYWAFMASRLLATDRKLFGSQNLDEIDILVVDSQVCELLLQMKNLSTENWEDFSRKQMKLADNSIFTGKSLVRTGVTVLYSFSMLVANISYTAAVFSGSDYNQVLDTSEFTSQLAHPCKVKIIANPSTQILLNKALAYTLRISDSQVVSYSNDESLILQSVLSSFSPCTAVSELAASDLQTSLAQVSKDAFNISHISVEEMTPESFGSSFESEYNWSIIQGSELTLMISANLTGELCCKIEVNPEDPVDSHQVESSSTNDWLECSNCICQSMTESLPTTLTIDLSNLNSSDSNRITCIICNSFPILPLCSSPSISFNYTLPSSSALLFTHFFHLLALLS